MFGNKNVAFIATGGAGRGISHIGVLKALEEYGVSLDMTIGASAGAIVTMFYNQYGNTDLLVDHFRPFWKRQHKCKKFGWSKLFSFKNFLNSSIASGIFDLSGAEKFLKDSLVTDNFNEVPIPSYVSVTNITKSEGVLIGPGQSDVNISRALVASCCLPILFRPVKIGDDYYMDGEIKRPLSLEAAINLGAEVVIISDMYKYSNLSDLRMISVASKVANMLLEDKTVRGIRYCATKYPEVEIILISPDASKFSIANTWSYSELIDAGYNAATEVLEKRG